MSAPVSSLTTNPSQPNRFPIFRTTSAANAFIGATYTTLKSRSVICMTDFLPLVGPTDSTEPYWEMARRMVSMATSVLPCTQSFRMAHELYREEANRSGWRADEHVLVCMVSYRVNDALQSVERLVTLQKSFNGYSRGSSRDTHRERASCNVVELIDPNQSLALPHRELLRRRYRDLVIRLSLNISLVMRIENERRPTVCSRLIVPSGRV